MNQPEIKKTMKTMIQIPHLELIFFLPKCRKEIIFLFFAQLKVQGRRKKKKNNTQKKQFYFYSSFGKIRVGGFRNQKNKKWWPYLPLPGLSCSKLTMLIANMMLKLSLSIMFKGTIVSLKYCMQLEKRKKNFTFCNKTYWYIVVILPKTFNKTLA